MPAEAEAGAGRRIGKLCIALACRVRALAAGGKSVEIAMSDDGTIAPVREEPGAGGDRRTAEIAEHERQFREILEYCQAGLNVVDEDGRLLFHNTRLRRLMGYDEEELHLFDTKRFWDDLDHRARIIERLRERGGELLDEEAVWKTKEGRLVHVLVSYAQVAYRGGHVSFVGGWNTARQVSASSTRRGGSSSTTPDCARSSATRRRSCISSTPSGSGTTSTIAPGSSRRCASAAASS